MSMLHWSRAPTYMIGKSVQVKMSGRVASRSTRPCQSRPLTRFNPGSGAAAARAAVRAATAGSRTTAMPPP